MSAVIKQEKIFYEWSDGLSVGVASIDRQHKTLIGLINELHECMAGGKGHLVARNILNNVIDYAKCHFIYEESLIRRHNYEFTAEHLASHKRISNELFELKVKSKSDPDFVIEDQLMLFLKDWLNNHILKEDMAYSELLISKNAK